VDGKSVVFQKQLQQLEYEALLRGALTRGFNVRLNQG
jgi:hypothetical protein